MSAAVGNIEPQDRDAKLSSIESVLLHSPEILPNIFLFAANNVSSIPPLSLTCSHWNTVLSTNNASNDCLWQQICGIHYPDTLPNSDRGRCYPQPMNIHDMCKFDDMSSSSTWKQLLQRRMTSPYVPFGSNKQLQRDMETAFRTEVSTV